MTPWRRLDPRHSDVVAQLPDALAIERRPLPFPARTTAYTLIAIIVVALLWASIAHVNRIVAATGKLSTRQAIVVIQPLDTAIIREIDVRAGDHVRAGQQIARLDPTFTEADRTALADKLASLDAQIARLRSELMGVPFGPADTPQRAIQARILAQRRDEFAATIADYASKAAEARAQIAANNASRGNIGDRLTGLRSIETMRRDLYRQGYSSEVQVLQARDSVLSAAGQADALGGENAQLRERIAGAEAERATFASDWRGKANEELITAQRDRDEAAEALQKATRMASLTSLSSPASGTVLEVAKRSVGSVLQPAEAFISVVPDNATMDAEVEIDAADIGLVRVNDPVRVKLDAFPFQRFGTLPARLAVISPDAFHKEAAEGGGAFYRATVRLDRQYLPSEGGPIRLTPGITVRAEIAVGRRSVISYLMYPVLRVFDEGLREPR